MRVLTPAEMRQTDRTAIEDYGFPGLILMEKAAMALRDAVRPLAQAGALFFCGSGNNGGDGLAAARMLLLEGCPVRVALLTSAAKLKGDARAEYELLLRCGGAVQEIADEAALAAFCAGAPESVAVDCLLGTGLDRAVSGLYAAAIGWLNGQHRPVIACDIPSGVDGRLGHILGCAVRAQKTVTFHALKSGLCLYPGREYAGEIVVADIGIPPQIHSACPYEQLSFEDAAALVPKRARDSHKGSYGHAALICGSAGMAGAARLAAGGALRSGTGLLTLMLPASLVPLLNGDPPEAMCLALPEKDGRIHGAAQAALSALAGKSAVGIGPGLGKDQDHFSLIRHILEQTDIPMLIDADGLNALAEDPEILRGRAAPVVLTPHPGEMARLCGWKVQDILKDPVGCAVEFAARWGCVVLLKGATTTIASPEGQVTFNATGNPGMAAGGSGDVLSGVITALLGQGLGGYDAARLGSYVHGAAGDLAAREMGYHGLTASDMHKGLARVFARLSGL